MKRNKIIKNTFITVFIAGLFWTACFTIMSVDQPTWAAGGEQITIKVIVRTEPDPAWGLINDGQFGLFAMMMPDDWYIDEISYDSATDPDTSDLGPMELEFLDPADPDGTPGDGTGIVDYWYDSLDVRYPAPEGMMWEVWQTVREDSTQLDTGYVEVTVKVTVGETGGDFNLAYFVTMASLDFDYDYQYSYSEGHPIYVSPSAIENVSQVPGKFSLKQNYPNPFNPTTNIHFSLKKQSEVQLNVYDVSGKFITNLANGVQSAGEHHVKFNASELSSGIYFYELRVGTDVLTRKMLVTK